MSLVPLSADRQDGVRDWDIRSDPPRPGAASPPPRAGLRDVSSRGRGRLLTVDVLDSGSARWH